MSMSLENTATSSASPKIAATSSSGMPFVFGKKTQMMTAPMLPGMMKARKNLQPIVLGVLSVRDSFQQTYCETHTNAVGADWSHIIFIREIMATPIDMPLARRWVGQISAMYVNCRPVHTSQYLLRISRGSHCLKGSKTMMERFTHRPNTSRRESRR